MIDSYVIPGDATVKLLRSAIEKNSLRLKLCNGVSNMMSSLKNKVVADVIKILNQNNI